MKVLIVKADTSRGFEEYCGKYINLVSEKRRKYIERVRSDRDRITSLTAELTLRSMITEKLGISGDRISFVFGEHGKPFLEGYDDFHFSISHSGEYVVCVCSGSEVGADIERNDRGNERIAARYFTDDEYRRIYEDGTESFAGVWTAKEAYVKYTGAGLSEGLDTFNVLDGSTGCRFESTEADGEYTVTVCTASDEDIVFEKISAEEIFSKY